MTDMQSMVTMGPTTFWFRPESCDLRIIDIVYARNGYHMPDDMTGQVVVDIGANIGTFTVLCAERGAARVLAYEPEPTNFQMLIDHTERVHEKVELYEVGLSNHEGFDTLYFHESNSGGHSTIEEVGPARGKVEVWRLDQMLPLHGDVDVLKLDCEGAEIYAIPAIIAGLHERIKTIVMEFHTPNQAELRTMLEPFYTAENLFQADWRFTHK